MFGTTGVVDAPVPSVNKEEEVNHSKTGEGRDGLGAEVGHPQCFLVSSQEHPPGIMKAIGGIGNPRRSQNPRHGASSGTASELESPALDARIASTDVLAGKTQGQIVNAFTDPRQYTFHARFSVLAAFGVTYPSVEGLGLDNGDDVLAPVSQGEACLQ